MGAATILTLLLPTVADTVDPLRATALMMMDPPPSKAISEGRGHALEHHNFIGDVIGDGFSLMREGECVDPGSQRIDLWKKSRAQTAPRFRR